MFGKPTAVNFWEFRVLALMTTSMLPHVHSIVSVFV